MAKVHLKDQYLFESILSTSAEENEFALCRYVVIEWSDFLLNPRRLRGSDFLMRWSQGVWSERRIVQAVNSTDEFFTIPYGPSGTAPNDDVKAFELYFEKLEAAGLKEIKRPDLLIFEKSYREEIDSIVHSIGGIGELPFIPESDSRMKELLGKAIAAIECENSLWRAEKMPDYGKALKPQRWLGGRLGLEKSAVLPTVILKQEDSEKLQKWQNSNRIPIHIWHVFYDMAFGISFADAQALIQQKLILPTHQTFQSPSGVITRKIIYKIYYHYAYRVGSTDEEPELRARFIQDSNGHILPYVHFEGGRISLHAEALGVLRNLRDTKSK
jgi:hypothetical protein